MKINFIESSVGNYTFNLTDSEIKIMAWRVIGNKTLIVSLERCQGDWLRLEGKFSEIQKGGAVAMQNYLKENKEKIESWLPVAIESARLREIEKQAERAERERIEKEKLEKDRSIKIYDYVKIEKGDHTITIITRVFEVGIYIPISDSRISHLIQLTASSHAKAQRTINRIINNFKKEGYEITKSKSKIDYSKIL
jgi:hypothetical protein